MSKTTMVLAGVVVGLAVTALVSTSTSASAAATTSGMTAGQTLTRGQAVYAPDRGVRFTLTTGGELAVNLTASNRVLWKTATSGTGSVLTFQSDGNLVLRNTSGAAVWATNTHGPTAAKSLTVYNDGEVIAAGTNGTPRWRSNPAPYGATASIVGALTSPNALYTATMQIDGNLVVRSRKGGLSHAIWVSGTAGHPGSDLVVQSDGNLVIYHRWVPLWNTHTKGTAKETDTMWLDMQNDGNLVLYRVIYAYTHPFPAAYVAVWATYTVGR